MRPNLNHTTHRQLAVFVGGGPESLAIVEPVLDGRAYDIEFVVLDDEPYATVAALKPDLVVVSLGMDDLAGFQLMPDRLSLDEYDRIAEIAGLTLAERWSTWDRDPWAAGGDYAVSVHTRA